jgi:hypothetical protein
VEWALPAHCNQHWAMTVELRRSWTSYGGAVEEPRNNIMWALQLISSNEYRAIRLTRRLGLCAKATAHVGFPTATFLLYPNICVGLLSRMYSTVLLSGLQAAQCKVADSVSSPHRHLFNSSNNSTNRDHSGSSSKSFVRPINVRTTLRACNAHFDPSTLGP